MKSRRVRNKAGFSLPTIVALGVIAGLWMLGTAAVVVPSIGRITVERARDVARSSAEASLDWGVQQMNNPDTRTAVDAKTSEVPSSLLGDVHYQGTLTVANIAPPVTSYLYDQSTDPAKPGSNIIGGNGWRVLTAVVSPQTAQAGTTRTVRVILKPVYQTKTDVVMVQTEVDGDPQNFFKNVLFAQGLLTGVGNFTTNSYDSAININPNNGQFTKTDSDVASNTGISMSSNTNIGGDVSVTNPVGNGDPGVVASGGGVVNENVTANGGVDMPGTKGTVSDYQTNDPQQLPPAPTAPSGSQDLGSLNLSGKETITLKGNGYKIGNGAWVMGGNGHFKVSQLSVTGQASIIVDNSAGPVNIHVEGSGSQNGVTIAGNGVSGTVYPNDLRIWYGGTGQVKVAGNGDMRGVIYAPNSDYMQVGNGTLYGAVVSNTMHLTGNGMFHYDLALGRNNDFQFIPKKKILTPNNVQSSVIKNFQAVSWDEM